MRDMSAFPDKAIYEFIHIAQWARNSSGLDKIEFWVLEFQNFFVLESLTWPQMIS